ncbi:MAG: riboflavin synthase [Xanthomonadales bacterium]|nr:riboflavin synthase [Gammaproteobacteria bacterium]NNJ65267.1 riboflavin synthase [Xanthomonadales bacterium]NNK37497.1 riboflavin synthase [Xanthomonadales bacterium]
MFTGIVTAKGRLRQKSKLGGDYRLHISSGALDLSGARVGDSICVSGTCLTMLDPERDSFFADVSTETLDLTTLGALEPGDPVNLELALRADDRMGGHLVTGHVDGLARLVSRHEDARAERFEFEVPEPLARYVARKGSVCLDGVSLTVNAVDGRRFDVCLIPHTLEVTTLGELSVGDAVNLEVDLVARYLERLMLPETTAGASEPPGAGQGPDHD